MNCHLLLAKEGESPDWADCGVTLGSDCSLHQLLAGCPLFRPPPAFHSPGASNSCAFSCFCGIGCHSLNSFLPLALSRADETETQISYCMVVSSLSSRVLLTHLVCRCLHLKKKIPFSEVLGEGGDKYGCQLSDLTRSLFHLFIQALTGA